MDYFFAPMDLISYRFFILIFEKKQFERYKVIKKNIFFKKHSSLYNASAIN